MPLHEQGEKGIVRIRYFGNLGLGRWQALRKIGEAVDKLNSNGRKAILEVYSNIEDNGVIRALTIDGACEYKGWVYGDTYLHLLQDADVVLHVESLDKDMMRRTWMSVSTKIADYLGAGKCILAFGNSSLASISHIKDVAYVVESYEKLPDALLKLVMNPGLRWALQEKARALALTRHDPDKIPDDFKTLIASNI